jgi:hypothetical protein
MKYEVNITCTMPEDVAAAAIEAGITVDNIILQGTDSSIFASAPAVGDIVLLNRYDTAGVPTEIAAEVRLRTFKYTEDLVLMEIFVVEVEDDEDD